MTNSIGGATIELAVDSSGVESGLDRVDGAVRRTGRTLDSLRTQGGGALGGIGADGVEASKKVDSATRNMIGSIQRTTAAMESGSRTSAAYYEVLASQRGVNVEALRPYLLQLDAVAAKQKAAAAAIRDTDPVMKQFGVSSGQTTAALQQMPAQLTDIFTSLAGGQNPLLVLIQQGGQIKDSFGGIGNTFRVLGGEVASFFSSTASASSAASSVAALGGALSDVAAAQGAVSDSLGQAGESLGDLADNASSATEAVANTRTALAGVAVPAAGVVAAVVAATSAVAALAVAYYQGSKEATAYTNALILTGNSAGTTSDQLADAARGMRQNGITQGAAAEALTALVSTGKVGAENLSRFASVSVQAQKSLGMSAASMAKDFADLGKAPLEAVESLNEKYHFLTLSTYEQINALQDQGRMQDAATVAQKAYADAIESRAKSTAASLGGLERAWGAVGGAAKKAWDYMLDIGRPDTLSEKLAAAEAALEKAKTNRYTFAGGGEDGRAAVAAAEAKVASLRQEKDASEWNAKVKAEGVRLDEAGIVWAKEGDKYLTRQLQLERDIETSRNMGLAAGASDVEISKRALEIRKKYSDIFSAGIDEQIEAVRRRASVEEESAKRSMVALVADRAAGLATSLLAEFKYADDVAKLDQEALARKRALLVTELALTAAKPNSKKEQAGLSGAIAETDAQVLTRTLQLKKDIAALDIKDTRQAAASLADLADKRTTDVQAIQSQLQAQKDANAVIGISAVEASKLNQSLVEEAATRKEIEAGILDTIIGRESEAASLRASAVAMRELGVEKAKGVSLTANLDATKAKELLDILVAVDNAAKQAAQGMTDSFGRVGSAIGGLTTALSGYAVQQQAIAAQLAAVKVDKNSGADKIAQAELAATKASATAKVKSYADMAGAAKGFFKESTAGYRALEGAEKAYRAVEMAMAVKAMIEKSGLLVAFTGLFAASKATEMAATVATVPVTVAAEGVKQTALATTAMAGAVAVPFPGNVVAFGIVAAMLAAIGLGGFGGGGGSIDVAKQRQAAAGTGSVLGDESSKSESIAKSIENLEKYSNIELSHTRGMLSALLTIRDTIGVVAAMATQTAGLRATAIDEKKFGVGSSSGVLGIGASSTTIQDSGIKLNGSQSIGSAISGIDAKGYVDIQKKNSGLWGIGASTSNRRDDVALDDSIKKQFGLVLASMRDGALSAIDLLGMSSAGVVDKINSMALGVSEISFKGLTGAEIQKELEAVFSKVGDEIAKVAAPELVSFQKVGEGYLQTLTRIATDYATVDSIMEATGKTFGAVGVASIEARERLISLAGGLDKLAEKNSYFVDNFLSDAEKAAPAIKYAAAEMAALGYSSVTTADQFKALVLSINPSTKAGGELYAQLLDLAPAFKTAADAAKVTAGLNGQIYDLTHTAAEALARQRQLELDAMTATDKELQKRIYALTDEKAAAALNGQIYDLTHTAAEALARQRQLELAAMTATDAALQKRINALNDEKAATQLVLSGVDAAYSKLQAVVGNEKEALNKVYQTSVDGIQGGIDRVTESVNKLKSLSQELHTTLDNLTVATSTKDDRQLAQAQIEAALAVAKAGGPLPDADTFKKSLSIVGKDASSQFSSYEDYQRDLYRARNNVGGLSTITDSKLKVDEQMLKTLQDAKKATEAQHKQDIAALDATLTQAKIQTDLLNGIHTSLMTLPQALANFASAVNVAKGNAPVAASYGIADLYGSLLGRAPDESGLAFYKGVLAKGYGFDEVRRDIVSSDEYKRLHPPGFAAGGDHLGGFRVVGEEGMELEATGPSRIFNASQTKTILGGDNSELVAEIRALKVEVVKLQESAQSTADNTKKSTNVLVRSTQGGDYLMTKAVPA
ncbi:phage tail length tape measure family protein [Rugamonas rubra]|uniref:Bacteriophage tail tape measure N-terminal domain-containing protein n=1 Tax=Rugamonas rubra TaxID=758825 RepID=A0A1I4SGG4_9BURK|nr:phage tail length tape measure family protein [Rugamonas rubra]SFM63522.1 protein of unknown function [Rugamonas rubra]